MKALNSIDQKIAELEQKKKQLRTKAATTLYRKLESLLGENFSLELVTGLVADQTPNATPALHDKWKKIGATFFPTTTRKRATKTPAPATTPPTPSTQVEKKAPNGSQQL
jgi:hypothetical protein